MVALMVTGPGRIELAEAPTESLSPGGVRVAIGAVGLCGTDFSLVSGTLGLNAFPVVPGHEVSGTVVESRSRLVSVGQKVVLDPLLSCGRCWACAEGRPQLCDGVGVIGVATHGGCRSEMVLDGAHWVPVPDGLALDDAALVEPTHVAVSTFRAVAAQTPTSILLLGAGAIGLILLRLVRHWWPNVPVFVSDPVSQRVDRAVAWGAEPVENLAGRLVECVVDGVGTKPSLEFGLDHVRRGGAVVVYGVPKAGSCLPRVDHMFQRNLRLTFTRLYGRDFTSAIGVLEAGVITAADIVGSRLTMRSAAQFLNQEGWRDRSHWGKALVEIGAGQNGNDG